MEYSVIIGMSAPDNGGYLNSEIDRLTKLYNEFSDIVGKLRNSLCVDLSTDNYDAGIGKVIADIIKQLTQKAIKIDLTKATLGYRSKLKPFDTLLFIILAKTQSV